MLGGRVIGITRFAHEPMMGTNKRLRMTGCFAALGFYFHGSPKQAWLALKTKNPAQCAGHS